MVSFPRLKLLWLRKMDFVDGILTNKLLSNCPILEELSLIQCGGLKCEALCIANFALKKLHIRSCDFGESTLKIYAPNLTAISYEGELPANFVFGSFLSLVEADNDVHNYREISAKTVVLIKLFELLSKVKILKMSGHSFLVLSQVDILLTDLPAFNNLIHLEVSSEFDWERVGSDPVSTLRILFRTFTAAATDKMKAASHLNLSVRYYTSGLSNSAVFMGCQRS
ncbi:F-box/LRR-repeat protein At3g59210-like isoform X1 [Papaver somniferum]|uniref:F-box/LRR-repeat protein At3g59210-like isoform X1 n=1 Tax=Papaver somniferum TaxID=3469 RepID=UPI000E6FA86F|nr:F-box/LRR-repeat protein At3g59210-like isoform X1 [Papaver somniferum]